MPTDLCKYTVGLRIEQERQLSQTDQASTSAVDFGRVFKKKQPDR